jgi:hypothetical protein
MKIKNGIVGLMKEEKKNKQEVFEAPHVVTMGKINLWLEKRKTKEVELMAKLGQVKLILDFMQSTIAITKKKLEVILAIENHVDPN